MRPASEMPPNPLQHPPPPQSESSDEVRPGGAQEVGEEAGEGSEHFTLSPTQLQELRKFVPMLVAEAVPKLIKGLVTAFTEGLSEQVPPPTRAHGKIDKKLDRRSFCGGSAQGAKMRAQESKSQERDDWKTQLGLRRSAVAKLRMGGQAHGSSDDGGSIVAGSSADFLRWSERAGTASTV